MAVVRWTPARSLRGDAFDRFFDGLVGSTVGREAAAINPSIRVWEAADAYTVQMVVPGLDRETLDIQAAPQGLSIAGKLTFPVPEGVTVRHSEFTSSEFRRTLQLATQIKSDAVRAHYTDGLLTITLPKLESQRVVKVQLEDTAEN